MKDSKAPPVTSRAGLLLSASLLKSRSQPLKFGTHEGLPNAALRVLRNAQGIAGGQRRIFVAEPYELLEDEVPLAPGEAVQSVRPFGGLAPIRREGLFCRNFVRPHPTP
jgi:hypothetical protein